MFGTGSGPTGPDEATMASLDAALSRPILAVPEHRWLAAFTEDYRRGLAASYRAGMVDPADLVAVTEDLPSTAPDCWPARDIVFGIPLTPDGRHLFVVRLQLAGEAFLCARLSAFMRPESGGWRTMLPLEIRPGGAFPIRPVTFPTLAAMATFAPTRALLCGAARIVSERHQEAVGLHPVQ
ncbi:hypothetical protein [Dankookia sp. P2]|uniref:hypothetical protein n=1 Tax=Dankookia sp. P2 TaxID=3423955 RepID=UPI003D66754C